MILHEKNSKEVFKRYLVDLVKKMKDKNFALLMDQAPVHRSNEVLDFCREKGIFPILSVSYSPDLNPIESVFAFVKNRFKKERLNTLMNNKDFDIEGCIRSSFLAVTADLVKANADRSYALLHQVTL